MTAVDDAVDELPEPHAGLVTLTTTSSSDPLYNNQGNVALLLPAGGAASIAENERFTLSDGTTTIGFELDQDGVDQSPIGDVLIDISGLTTATEVADAIAAAISAQFGGTITPTVVGDRVELAGADLAGSSIANAPSLRMPAPAVTVDVDVYDDDTAGIVADDGGSVTAVSEDGTTDTFTVTLNSQPTGDVTVTISPNGQVTAVDSADGDTTLVFTPANWNVAQTVRVSAVDDQVDEVDPHTGQIVLSAASTTDAIYDGAAAADVTVTVNVNDNDEAGVTANLIDGQLLVTEGGAGDSFTVVLNTQPTAAVTVTLTTNGQTVAIDAATVNNATPATFLTFDASNWNVPQTVLVSAVDDDVDELDPHSGQVTLEVSSTDTFYDAVSDSPLPVSVFDNDTAGISLDLSPDNLVWVREGGETDSFRIRLNSKPTGDVTITLNPDEQVTATSDADTATLIFTPDNWNVQQTVTVTANNGANDVIDEGPDTVPHLGQIELQIASADDFYDALPSQTVDVDVFDNDTASLVIVESDGSTDVTEGGQTDSFTVRLATEPTSNVTVTLTPDAQVTAADAGDGDTTLVFTPDNWDTPQTVTVTANGVADDNIDEGPDDTTTHPGTVTLSVSSADEYYDALADQVVDVDVSDNDTAGVSYDSNGVSIQATEGGSTGLFDVFLDSQPTGDVTVTLSGIQVTAVDSNNADNDYLIFTPENWNVPQQVRVIAIDDDIDEGADDEVHAGVVTLSPASATDAIFDAAAADVDVPIEIFDNDTAGFAITESDGSTDVVERTGYDTFTVVLNSEPLADVTITLDTDAQVVAEDAANLGNQFLVFTPANWNTPQTVRVTAVEDFIDEEDPHEGHVTLGTLSTDQLYRDLSDQTVTVNVTDIDTAAVLITATGKRKVTEGSGSFTYTVVLGTQPTDNVTVLLNTDGQVLAEDNANPGVTQLVFTPTNWNVARTVKVTAVNDDIDEADIHLGRVIHEVSSDDPYYAAVADQTLVFDVVDNDTAGVTVTPGNLALTEGGASDTYTVMLTSQPTADVTIQLDAGTQLYAEADADPGTTTLTFTPDNWDVAQTVRVTAIDDHVAEEDPHSGSVAHQATSDDASYDGITIAELSVSITENETAGLAINLLDGSLQVSEDGTTDSFTVALSSLPSADVTVTFNSAAGQVIAEDAANPGSSSIVFTPANWNVPQTILLSAVNDAIDEADVHEAVITPTGTSADPQYNVNFSSLTAQVTDDDTAGVTVDLIDGAVDVAEGGATDTFTVVLDSQPTAGVLVTLVSDNQATADENGEPINAFLVFTPTNWNVPQTVRVTAIDDDLAEADPHAGQITVQISSSTANSQFDPIYDALPDQVVPVSITDNDQADVTVSLIDGAINVSEAGTTDTFSVVLDSEPTSDVTVTLAPDAQLTAEPQDNPGGTQLVFTAANWSVPQIVQVGAVDDAIDEGDNALAHTGTITLTVDSTDPVYADQPDLLVNGSILDDDIAGVEIRPTDDSTAVTEGGAGDTYEIVLSSEPTADVTIAVSPDSQLSAAPLSATFTPENWNVPQQISVDAIDDAFIEGLHSGTISHQAASTDPLYDALPVADLLVDITDNDVLGDDFNREDNTVLGTLWTEQVGDLDVVSNSAAVVDTSTSLATFNGVLETDVAVQADVDVSDGASHAGVFARYSGPGDNNMYLGAIVNDGNGGITAQIWRSVGGNWEFLSAAPLASAAGTLRFEVVGNALSLYWDNVFALQVVDTQIQDAGQVGVRGSQGTQFDNFVIAEQTPVTATLPFDDDFNLTAGSPLQAAWSAAAGTYSVQSSQAEARESGLNIAVLNGVVEADVVVQAQVSVAEGPAHAGLIARYSGPGDNNMYLGALVNDGVNTTAQIWRNVGGVWTQIASGPVDSPIGILRFEVYGSSLRLSFGGELAAMVSDSAISSAGWSECVASSVPARTTSMPR